MRVAILLFGASLVSITSGADPPKTTDPAATYCVAGDDDSIRRMEADLDYADHVLPNVPPEEDRYLTAESARAQKVYNEEQGKHLSSDQSNKIHWELRARKLYYPWAIRKELAKLTHDVAKILSHKPSPEEPFFPVTYRGNDEAAKLELATRAIPSAQSYLLQVTEYVTAGQLGKAPSLMSLEQFNRVYIDALSLSWNLSSFMECKLAKVMGPQPLGEQPLAK